MPGQTRAPAIIPNTTRQEHGACLKRSSKSISKRSDTSLRDENQGDTDPPSPGEGMQSETERDYILGTHDDEVIRIGLQHRVWRPVVLDLWQGAGITVGNRMHAIGDGP